LFATVTATPITFTPTETPLVPDQLPTQTFVPSLTPPPVSTSSLNFFTPVNRGFLTILLSNSVIYWNSGPCMPRNIKVTVFVEDLVHTDKVYLMVRAREKSDTMLLEPWSSPAEMLQGDNGSFSYNITTDTIKRYYYHLAAWLEYQMVSMDKNLNEIARTQVYDRNISLVMCRSVSP
jgi:hypothetical protein